MVRRAWRGSGWVAVAAGTVRFAATGKTMVDGDAMAAPIPMAMADAPACSNNPAGRYTVLNSTHGTPIFARSKNDISLFRSKTPLKLRDVVRTV